MLSFQPNEDRACFDVDILDDQITEGQENFTARITSVTTGVTIGNPAVTTISITDDESETTHSFTVEPPKRDTMGTMIFSLVERSSLSRRSNNYKKSISMGLKQVSFVERSFLSQTVLYQRFHCITYGQQFYQ